ncbi:hypothetical protein MMC28_007384 [Mycoblastus sanguinarius]|nr:hypothetical protein [Mycoblastus sanguinarius]
MDPVVFKDPTIYCPERWLEGDVAELEKYMCSFSGGSRGCLGNNLAYAELYLTLAHLFRRFDLSLYQTTEKDVEWDDSFVPITRGHLKVLIQRARD